MPTPLETPFIHESIVVPVTPEFPRNGEGDAVVLKDGRVLLVYGEFAASGDAAPATLQALESADRGRTWGDKRLLQENIGGRNIMSVSLARLSNDDILLLFIRKDTERDLCMPMLRRSSDEGRTWSEPTSIPAEPSYYVVNNDRLAQLSTGRVLIPSCCHGVNWSSHDDIVFMSDDLGETWRTSPPVPFLDASKSGPQEPGVVELKDGRVMMWCRCDLGEIYRCYSEDGAETFGPWEPMGLKAPCSPATIKRLPSTGELLCLFNNHATPPGYWAQTRAPMTAAVSSDEAATWGVVGDLEPDRTLSNGYTSVTFVGDGEVLLTYYLGSDEESVQDGQLIRKHRNLAHLKVAVFSEEWLRG